MWSAGANWAGGVAPISGTDTAVQSLGGQTANAGTLTVDSGTAAFSLNALELSGTSPASGTATVVLTGGPLQFTDTAGGQLPTILLDAMKSGTGTINYTVGNALAFGNLTTIYGSGNGGFALTGSNTFAAGMVKQGTSGVTLSGFNSFSGGTVRIEGGTLALANINAAYKATAIYVSPGAQLAVTANGSFNGPPIVLNGFAGGSNNAGGALRFNVSSANIAWPGAVTLADDSQITFFSAGGAYRFTSPITGSGNLQFCAGARRLTILARSCWRRLPTTRATRRHSAMRLTSPCNSSAGLTGCLRLPC